MLETASLLFVLASSVLLMFAILPSKNGIDSDNILDTIRKKIQEKREQLSRKGTPDETASPTALTILTEEEIDPTSTIDNSSIVDSIESGETSVEFQIDIPSTEDQEEQALW